MPCVKRRHYTEAFTEDILLYYKNHVNSIYSELDKSRIK